MDADPSDTDVASTSINTTATNTGGGSAATSTVSKGDSHSNPQNTSDIKNDQSESNNGKSTASNNDSGNTSTNTGKFQSLSTHYHGLSSVEKFSLHSLNVKPALSFYLFTSVQPVVDRTKILVTIPQPRWKVTHRSQIAFQNLSSRSEKDQLVLVIVIAPQTHQGKHRTKFVNALSCGTR